MVRPSGRRLGAVRLDGRTLTVLLLVAGLLASLLVLTVPTSAAHAADPAPPPGVTNRTTFTTDCIGRAAGFGQPETNALDIDTTAPETVAPDEEYTIRIAPRQGAMPDEKDSIIGKITVNYLKDISLMYDVPSNATLVSATVVPDTSYGIEGTPTIVVDTEAYAPGRVILKVPLVPKDKVPPTNETFFRFPAIDLVVRATGSVGTSVATRVSGTTEASAGYVFKASAGNNDIIADVRCWPQGNVPAPVMANSLISSGGENIPTTTSLTVDPVIVAGTPTTLRAQVSTSIGVVRFSDGANALGFAEVNEAGVATLSAALHVPGQRTLTAHYFGGPGFNPSDAEPVTVTVVDPASREPVRVLFTPNPADPMAGQYIGATIDVLAPDGSPTDATGTVRVVKEDGTLIAELPVVDGRATAAPNTIITATVGGNLFHIAYSGDLDHQGAEGWWSRVTPQSTVGSFAPSTSVATTGSVTFNGTTTPLPAGTIYNSSFRSDGSGRETLEGALVVPSMTIAFPGGTVTGQLSQVGPAVGSIAPGADGAAELGTEMVFVVTSADLGQGPILFGQDCLVGPFAFDLTGTRVGTNGLLSLADAGAAVPFAPADRCVAPDGTALGTRIGGLFAGTTSAFSVDFTPPAAGAAVAISAVTASTGNSSFYGQPVTLSASVTRPDNLAWPSGVAGRIDFYRGDRLITGTNVSGSGPVRTASVTVPTNPNGILPGQAPLPEGQHEIWAKFSPAARNRLVLRDSLPSAPVLQYSVWPELPKTTPTVTVEAPATAAAGEVVTVTVRISPAPNAGGSPAPLTGRVKLLDANLPVGAREVAFAPDQLNGGPIIPATNDGTFQMKMAAAPGEHQLYAELTPLPTSQWWWGKASSAPTSHTVLGERIATDLRVVGDTTRGTGKVVQGQSLTANLEMTPVPISATGGPWGSTILLVPQLGNFAYITDGRGTFTMPTTEVGTHSVKIIFNPDTPYMNNQGYTGAEVTYTYEVLPADTDPVPTAVQVTSLTPSVPTQGTAWDRLEAYVSAGATGSMAFSARNTSSGTVTPLGTGPVAGPSDWMRPLGQAELVMPAPSADLVAGTYEVTAAFTPDDPQYSDSTSAPFTVRVVASGAQVSSTTALSVSPSPSSNPGGGVWLTANVTPGDADQGTVRFFDGETEVASATTLSGKAQVLVTDLALGDHGFQARFEPAIGSVAPSSSPVVAHVVGEPTVETTTALAVSPEGTTLEGDAVTLTATVSPGTAVGSVEFSSGATVVGTAPVAEGGVATLTTSALPLGANELTAEFVPADPLDFGGSTSLVVMHQVDERPVGPVPTSATLTVLPSGSSVLGEDVVLTASLDPASAVGTVTFLDGASTIGGPVTVVEGEASFTVVDPALGAHGFAAVFTPSDPEDYVGSTSPTVAHQVTLPEGDPVMDCVGGDQMARTILEGILPGGVVTVVTPVAATVPGSLDPGGSSPVSFTWSFTIPPELAELAGTFGADLALLDMDLAIVASGGGAGTYDFPDTLAIPDPNETVTTPANGTVTAGAGGTIIYTLRSPANMTVNVTGEGVPNSPINLPLDCTFSNNIVAITDVSGDATVPGAPTGVSATGGPLQATVSWTAPADDGGSPITGYVVTSGTRVVHTSAAVTSVDVVGLTEGESYVFTVKAVNSVGESVPSAPSGSALVGPATDSFSDVPPGHLFFSEITWLAERGITTGFDDGTFKPTMQLSRQAMAAFLYRLAGEPAYTPTGQRFSDVPASHQFYLEIEWLAATGITSGYPDGTFRPTGTLTRGEMAAFLYRAAGSPDGANPGCTVVPFSDVAVSSNFCGEITWLVGNNIAEGFPDGTFRPGNPLTRQAMAAFLYRYTLVEPGVIPVP